MHRNLVFVVVLFILTSTQESNASLVQIIRKLAQEHNPKENLPLISPSPSPASSTNRSSGGTDDTGKGSSPKEQPNERVTDERCGEPLSIGCQVKNMTACLRHAGNGSQVSFLVQNDGESSLKVKIKALPVDTTFKETNLSEHQAKKINISSNVEAIQSIVLNAGNGKCVIDIGFPPAVYNNHMQFPYATYVTPIHGAYVLILTVMVIGGAWACCSCGKRGRHLDGVPYQELEMGQSESVSATNVETLDGWDQGWDDDWDEEKAVKSPGIDRVGNGRTNGITPKSSKGDD